MSPVRVGNEIFNETGTQRISDCTAKMCNVEISVESGVLGKNDGLTRLVNDGLDDHVLKMFLNEVNRDGSIFSNWNILFRADVDDVWKSEVLSLPVKRKQNLLFCVNTLANDDLDFSVLKHGLKLFLGESLPNPLVLFRADPDYVNNRVIDFVKWNLFFFLGANTPTNDDIDFVVLKNGLKLFLREGFRCLLNGFLLTDRFTCDILNIKMILKDPNEID